MQRFDQVSLDTGEPSVCSTVLTDVCAFVLLDFCEVAGSGLVLCVLGGECYNQ